MLKHLARLRVPLGFACFVVAFWLARPTRESLLLGIPVSVTGELVRLWASGHIEKGREVTRSGPYAYTRHPLYLGSTIMGVGFVIAARSLAAAALVLAYLGVTLVAAVRTEEATLEARFSGEYAAYREGRAAPDDRPFSVSRVVANREHRAIAGLVLALVLLCLRSRLG